jgi:hypothetical protein
MKTNPEPMIEWTDGDLPPQDPNGDRIYEYMDDPSSTTNVPGAIGPWGTSLSVPPSKYIH